MMSASSTCGPFWKISGALALRAHLFVEAVEPGWQTVLAADDVGVRALDHRDRGSALLVEGGGDVVSGIASSCLVQLRKDACTRL